MQEAFELIPVLSTVMLIACGILAFLMLNIYKHRDQPGGIYMLLLLMGLFCWCFFQALELISNSEALKILLSQLSYVGVAFVAPLFLLFVYHYVYQIEERKSSWGRWIFIESIIVLILAFTNDWHGWVWTGFTPILSENVMILLYHHGPATFIHVYFSYSFLLIALIMLIRHCFLQQFIHKKRTLLMIVALLLPWVGNVLYVYQLTPLKGIDFSPIALTLTALIFVLVFTRYQFFEIKPIALNWLFKSMREGVLVFNQQNQLMLANQQAKQWAGLNRHSYGISIDCFRCFEYKLKDILPNEFDTSNIIEHHEESGRKWYKIEKTPLTNSHNFLIGYLVILRDITESKSQEEKLKKMQLRQQALLDSLPFIAWLKDVDGNYLAVNKKYQEEANLPFHQIIGKKDPDIWPEALAKQYVKNDDQVMQSKNPQLVEEKLETDKGVFWVETYKAPMLNDQGNVEGTTGFARDITEQKNLELAKNEFISMVSHEMRTPLTSIINSMKMMLDKELGPLNEKQKEVVNIGQRNASRLARFINDVLDFEKIKKSGLVLNFTNENFAEVIHEAVEMLQPLLKKDVEIKVTLAEDLPMIEMDREKMLRVMINLINNALKFTEKGAIAISACFNHEEDTVLVSVKDTGIGIKKEDLQKIFATFVQVSPASYRKPESSGLGLSICQEIILKHTGKIWVQSQLGEGSTFFFKIPRKQ